MANVDPLDPFIMADLFTNLALDCNVDKTVLASIWIQDEILGQSVAKFEQNNPGRDWQTSTLYTSQYVSSHELLYFFNLSEYPPITLPELLSDSTSN